MLIIRKQVRAGHACRFVSITTIIKVHLNVGNSQELKYAQHSIHRSVGHVLHDQVGAVLYFRYEESLQ